MIRRRCSIAVFVLLTTVALSISFVIGSQISPPETGKLSWGLFEAATSLVSRSGSSGDPIPSLSAMLILKDGSTEDKAQVLDSLGYTVDGAFGPFVLVSAPGNVYIDQERGIDAVDFVSNAMLPPTVMTNEFQTDGAAGMGVDVAHAKGFLGGGTRIAIIDGGFLPGDASSEVGNATYYLVTPTELSVRVEAGQVAEEQCHGAACAEIAADVAPEAELYLLSFPQDSGVIGWLYALDYAVSVLHADVVSCSLEFLFPTCHADGTGVLNATVDSIMDGTGSTLVVSSGNWAMGGGSDSGFYWGIFTDTDGDYRHDFSVNASEAWDRNTMRFSGRKGDLIQIILEWDDWNSDVKTQDLDLILSVDGYEQRIDASLGEQFGTSAWPCEAIVLELPYTAEYCVTVENRAASVHGVDSGPLSFHVNLKNSTNAFAFIEHTMARGSVREIATNEAVIAVGAVSVDGTTLFSYSSRGPTSDGRMKPELLSPAGVTGTCYDLFHGTSASAPYAASALAVLLSAFPDSTVAEQLEILSNVGRGGTDDAGNSMHIVDLVQVFQEASE